MIKLISNIHLHRRHGQVEDGLGGVHHVGGEDVQSLKCTCFQSNFWNKIQLGRFKCPGTHIYCLGGQLEQGLGGAHRRW